MDLRQERHVGACVKRLDRGAHACATGADDEHVVRGFHLTSSYRMLDGVRIAHSSR
jgi:hypothetical protein